MCAANSVAPCSVVFLNFWQDSRKVLTRKCGMLYRHFGRRVTGHHAVHGGREEPAAVQSGGGVEADGGAGEGGVQEGVATVGVDEAAGASEVAVLRETPGAGAEATPGAIGAATDAAGHHQTCASAVLRPRERGAIPVLARGRAREPDVGL